MTSFTPMSSEEGQARRKNSIVIGLVLFAMVALFYAVTIVRLQGNMAKREAMASQSGGKTSVAVPTSSSKTH